MKTYFIHKKDIILGCSTYIYTTNSYICMAISTPENQKSLRVETPSSIRTYRKQQNILGTGLMFSCHDINHCTNVDNYSLKNIMLYCSALHSITNIDINVFNPLLLDAVKAILTAHNITPTYSGHKDHKHELMNFFDNSNRDPVKPEGSPWEFL